ncbi:MAG: tRNA lysidine(34) synthetase TilS [Candidatus Omnitrophica bacterium]|nr:tRNA lysidine(34) synthetase TilS [Candidatus Omnitrophota bacterium]
MIRSQFEDTIKKYSLIKKGDRVLACVSGGPDSMAMLDLLSGLKRSRGMGLAVAHLDHMIRGRRSKADAVFVKKASAKAGIPFYTERISVKEFAKKTGLSTEEAAREARYAFYQRAAAHTGADKIATGHNMDDQAETVLMRLIKGAGSRGLSGIPYKRALGARTVIRPLLDIRRSDIEQYLKDRKIPSRNDLTNLKTAYLRNKIRHVLLPALEKEFNPGIKEVLNFTAKSLSGEFDYINNIALAKYRSLIKKSGSSIWISIKRLSRQHIALRRLIVRHIIDEIKGDLRKISFKHWQGVESILSGEGKPALDLPGGIKCSKSGGDIVFSKTGRKKQGSRRLRNALWLDIPGTLEIPELGLEIESEIVGRMPRFKKNKRRKNCEYINGDIIEAPLKLRTWKSGDRMRPLGMKDSKKLHDIFIDDKVPKAMRDRIPLVLSKKRILWAVGHRISEDCRINGNVNEIVKLSVKKIKKIIS